MRPISWVIDRLDEQRGYLFPWAPVFYGTGIAIYFALRFEPGRELWILIAALSLVAGVAVFLAGPATRLFLLSTLLLAAGFSIAGIRTHSVAEQVLGYRYYGPIEGRIVAIDRSVSDAVRLTLDRVVLRDIRPERTPARVRIALHGRQGFVTPEPGVTVVMTGHLSPPGGAVEPGGYDFRRHAWFQRLGAVGYTRTPVLAIEGHQGFEFNLWVYRARMAISDHVRQVLPGREGAFAAAITTGDRSALDREVMEDLRAANLAHLLAISGLHMGLLTGFVFAALRYGLALLSLWWPTRKIAALGALVAGAVYLALSGGNVATERAFIMVAAMFLALLLNRRAVTLRAVAVAALIVLTLRPEAIYGPGFQMSFAATTALVVVFGALREVPGQRGRWPRWLRFAFGVTLSSFVAGMATAPIAALHFNQVPHYGLLANVVSVPLMGAVIIPGAVLAALLAPFGFDWIGLSLMAPAIGWILGVAETVSAWPGSLSFVIAPGPWVLPVLAAGALWLAIWQGRGRFLGAPVMGLALFLWSGAERPAVLVSQSGGLVGVMTEQGRAMSKAKGDGFSAEVWLENDGDPVLQAEASQRMTSEAKDRMRWIVVGEYALLHATGKVAASEARLQCGKADLVVVNVALEAPAGCRFYDLGRLRREGALAVSFDKDAMRVITAHDRAGTRPWSP